MKLNSKYIPAAILIQSFFLLTTSFISKALAENCQYSVNKDNGKQYNISDMSDFVKNEIRPEIQQSERLFNVNIIRNCDNFANEKVTIGMNSKNYYVLSINAKDISTNPTNIVDYNNRLGLDLDKNTFIEIVNATPQYDFSIPIPTSESRSYKQLEELYNKQRILKMYAFVFAETARFEDAYNSLDKIFKSQCSIDWHDFDALVHNWSNMSRLVIKNGLLEASQFKNGSLVAPITTKQTQKFVSELEEGQNIEYSKSVPFVNYDYERCGQAGN